MAPFLENSLAKAAPIPLPAPVIQTLFQGKTTSISTPKAKRRTLDGAINEWKHLALEARNIRRDAKRQCCHH